MNFLINKLCTVRLVTINMTLFYRRGQFCGNACVLNYCTLLPECDFWVCLIFRYSIIC